MSAPLSDTSDVQYRAFWATDDETLAVMLVNTQTNAELRQWADNDGVDTYTQAGNPVSRARLITLLLRNRDAQKYPPLPTYVATLTYQDGLTEHVIGNYPEAGDAWAALATLRAGMLSSSADADEDDTYLALRSMSAQAQQHPRYMTLGKIAGLGLIRADATYEVRHAAVKA